MNPRDNDPDGDLMEIAAAVFHGRVAAMDANGNYSGIGHNAQPFSGAITARPYGLRSRAPVNTGLVLTHSQAGLMVLSNVNALPTGVTEPLEGETLLYNSQGAQVRLDENGDVDIVQKSGRFVNIGSSPRLAALASLVNDELDSIQGQLSGHKHSGVTTGPGTSGVSDSTYVASDVDATETKIT